MKQPKTKLRNDYWDRIRAAGGYLVNRKFVDSDGDILNYQAHITVTYQQPKMSVVYWPHLRTLQKLDALKRQTRVDSEGNVLLLYPEMVKTLQAQHDREIKDYASANKRV